MNKRWQQLNQWFQQQPRDRRILIAILVWVLIAVYMGSTLLLPNIKAMNSSKLRTEQLAQQLSQVRALNEQLKSQLQQDVNQPGAMTGMTCKRHHNGRKKQRMRLNAVGRNSLASNLERSH